jgi:hypothetical protein
VTAPEPTCPCPVHSQDRARPVPARFGLNAAGFITTALLTDGRVLCPVCCEYRWPCELSTDDTGTVVDLCRTCARREAAAVELAALLGRIVASDTEYDARYPLVVEAVHVALSAGFRAGIRIDPAEPTWPVVYIELPDGQVSWHAPEHSREWDQHTTADKFDRIRRYQTRVREPE